MADRKKSQTNLTSQTSPPAATSINVAFFDNATQQSIEAPASTSVNLTWDDGDGSTTGTIAAQGNPYPQVVDIGQPPSANTPVTLQASFSVQWIQYTSAKVSTMMPAAGDTSVVPIPCFPAEQTCAVAITTHDSSGSGAVNDVEVIAIPVITPVGGYAGASSARGAYRGRTSDGSVTIDVACGALYRFDFRCQGYAAVSQYLFIGCETSAALSAQLQACATNPQRILVLTDQCNSPASLSSVLIGGQSAQLTQNGTGLYQIPASLTGRVPVNVPGMNVDPTYLELHEDTPYVLTAKVSDPSVQGAPAAGMSYHRLVDEEGTGYSQRTVYLESLTGETSTAVTNPEGGFYAQDGTLMHAKDDEQGLATDVVVLQSTGY